MFGFAQMRKSTNTKMRYTWPSPPLRPVSREQVEKVWRGEWMALDECSNEGVYCKRCKKKVYRIEYANEKMRSPFCPACGAAQTDEAVEMVMEIGGAEK